MPAIVDVVAREILDCRGIPTVEASVVLDNGIVGTSSVPTGTSTAAHEALEVRDNDPKRYGGLGVARAVANVVNIIAPQLRGKDPVRQGDIDGLMISLDGTQNKSKLGVNAILPVSQAVTKAAAAVYALPVYKYLFLKYKVASEPLTIPSPAFNVINGGKHGAGNLDFQEFMLVPSTRFPFHQALQIGVELFYALERALINKNAIHSTGTEGGFAPNLFTNLDALEIMMQAIKTTPYQYGHDVFLSLDVSAETILQNGKYVIKDRSQAYTNAEFVNYFTDLNEQYHLFALEDPLGEDDWDAWAQLTQKIGHQVMIVGDNLVTSNKKRLQKAIEKKACTAVVIKPNQIGTVTEAVEAAYMVKQAGMSLLVSNRSGETNDEFMADFGVAMGADYAKFGAPNRGERINKYNRLLGIEAELAAAQSQQI